MLQVIAIPALQDNYIWLLKGGADAVVVDPGDAKPVLEKCSADEISVRTILITHHHADHVDGVDEIKEKFPDSKIYAPKQQKYKFPYTHVSENARVEVEGLGLSFNVIETPGHTNDHVSYYTPGHLFCGDTIFGCGCGKLLEGSAKELFISLEKLAALPDETLIYCGHEYTLDNIRFAMAADPNNSRLESRERAETRKRSNEEPTLPSTMELEKATNPFLRWNAHSIKSKAEKRLGKRPQHTYEILAALRKWKDKFGEN
jgi:hydroxyacylglutathione hydrolase